MSKKVYEAITRVTAAMATEGIGKDRSNQAQGYKFRGIDDVYNALSRHLANASLCVLPKVLERECVERQTAKGTALFYVTVKVDFHFVSAEDASEHVVTTYGEAMDSGDKATNKAMSAAYKYAAMQTFCIPTEGDNDVDASSHTVTAKSITPTTGAMDRFTAAEQKFLIAVSESIMTAFVGQDHDEAYKLFYDNHLQQEEQIAIWSLLDSKIRSSLKKMKESKNGAA